MVSISLVLLLLDMWEIGNMMAERRSREMTIMMNPEAYKPRILERSQYPVYKGHRLQNPIPDKDHDPADLIPCMPGHSGCQDYL